MTRIILAIALCAAISCDFARNVIWPTTVTCGAPIASALVDEVRHIVESGADGWERALEKLAADYGPELIACILGQLIDGWLPGNGLRAEPAAANYAARAQGFLNDHQVTVQER